MAARAKLSTKIFAIIFAVSVAIMLVSSFAATAASFTSYEEEAEELLNAQTATYAKALEGHTVDEAVKKLEAEPFVDVRCTLIAKDGTVLFDNYADPSTLGNHNDREEVKAARASGSVTLMRHSNTLESFTLYAAALSGHDMVIRLAETRTSLASFVGGMWWRLALFMVIIFIVSFILSRWLARKVMAPLKSIDLSAPLDNNAYAELQPLLERVDEQHRELSRQNKELQQAMEMRREFTGNVSHEMKTPLQVIGGYAELIENGMVAPEDIQRFAGLIREEAKSMKVTIDDVLTLSRLDESVDGAAAPVNLAEACKHVVDKLKPTAEQRNVSFALDLDESVMIMGDILLVSQLLTNLCSNAIKYNKEGGVALVEVRRKGDRVQLIVSDQGIGIPEELRERVFERFFRVDPSHNRQVGGTGLGLAIVKHAVEKLGGTIRVEDSDLGGAAFRVELPLA